MFAESLIILGGILSGVAFFGFMSLIILFLQQFHVENQKC